jgi:hypothetical protein
MKHQEHNPRLNKNKKRLCYSINDFHSSYKKSRKAIDHLDKKDYTRIMKRVFAEIAEYSIKERRPYNPKIGLGRFGVVKRKCKTTSINWKASKEHGKHIFYRNSHTNGHYFRWHWERTTKCNLRGKKLYSFSVVPRIKDMLHNHIMKLEGDPYSKPYDTLTNLPPYEN